MFSRAVFKIFLMSSALFFTPQIDAYALGNDHALSPNISNVIKVSGDVEIGSKAFIEHVSQRGIGFLSNENFSTSQRQQAFEKLLEDSFDMKTIARFAMGRYWRAATDSQKSEYLKLFETMIVKVYSGRFQEYNGQDLIISATRPEGESDVVVTSKIIPDQGAHIHLDWRVRYKNGQYKIVDVMVEGVSMALTQRSDFSSVIQRGGGNIEVLLEHLRQP